LVAGGKTPFIVGLTSLYGLAWNFKFVVGPLVDKTATLKKWILPFEVALAVTVLALSVAASFDDLATISVLFAVLAVYAAIHDVAVDGFYIAALEVKAQA